eukprot:02342.XXX_52843_51402_1 [CDS] Oithona nana genome sequencing.
MTSQEKNYGMGFEQRHKLRTQSRQEKQTLWVRGEDGEMVECEVLSTKDRESIFAKNAPILPLPIAIICGILNFVPGLGTLLGAFLSPCCAKTNLEGGSKFKTFYMGLLTGLLQVLLSVIIVGILWSISYGVMLLRKSLEAKRQEKATSSTTTAATPP